ncbi:MAG: hypothetical protein P1V97_19105, partial [Planctomycetota bacterium]|nr:hypothetical protein [Planctomycetota bacterium]
MVKRRNLSLSLGLALTLGVVAQAIADGKKNADKQRVARLKALAKDLQGKDAKKVAKAQLAFREDLKSEILRIREAMRLGQKAIGLRRVKGILPNKDHVRIAFRKDSPKADLEKVAKFYKTWIPQDDEALAQVLKVDSRYTRVRVHQASGAELKTYKTGSVPWKHFPGACKRLAKSHLREDLLYYEVEFLMP